MTTEMTEQTEYDKHNEYNKYYVCQSAMKINRIKERIVSQLPLDFKGIINIILRKTVYGHVWDHTTRNYYYVLDNTDWIKINYDKFAAIRDANKLEYEHLRLE